MVTIQCGTVRFEQIEAIIFDKDGTLADSQSFLQSLGQKRARLIDAQIPGVGEPLLMAFGLEGDRLNPAGLLAVGTRDENEIAAAAYVAETGRDWIESLQIVRSMFSEADKVLHRKADSTPLFAGALSLLYSLATHRVKVGILSSDTTANVQDFVDRYQLNSLVQIALGSDVQLSKPNPQLLHRACERLGVLPAATLVIGDSAADVEMARSANAAGCLGVDWGWTSPLNLDNVNALAQSFTEICVLPETSASSLASA